MKKFSVLVLGVFALSSCVKSYDCNCSYEVYDSDGQVQSTGTNHYELEAKKKSDADAKCAEYNSKTQYLDKSCTIQ